MLLLTNAIEGPENNKIQILPYGHVVTKKGDFVVDEEAEKNIMENFKNRKNDVVVDYEHQTLTGEIAPAAGWIKNLENRGKDGIWAEVEWTSKAHDFIANKEYKYLSPVIFVAKGDKRVQILHSAALTNDPAIDGMVPIANKLEIEFEDDELEDDDNMNEELLKKMAAACGLPEDATPEQILQACLDMKKACDDSKNKQDMSVNKEVLSMLGLKDDSNIEDVKGKIIALKDPSNFVSKEDFKKLQDKLVNKEKDEIVTAALKAGKLTPAQKEWAEAYALKDMEGFKKFIEGAPQVVPYEKIDLKDTKPKSEELDEVDLAVCKQLGISAEEYKKVKGGQ